MPPEQTEPNQQDQDQNSTLTPDKSDNFWRRKAEDLEKKVRKAEQSSLTELERYRAENADLTAEVNSLRSQISASKLSSEFAKAARAAGVHDPEMAFLAVQGDLTLADGQLIGAEKALKKLKSAKPYLFEGGGKLGSGGAGRAAADSSNPNELMNNLIRGRF